MEAHIDASYLRPGPLARASAIGIVSLALGSGVLLASWGISMIWRAAPPVVQVANPELTMKPSGPLIVQQRDHFVMAPPDPLKVDPITAHVVTDQPVLPTLKPTTDGRGSEQEVIRRQVTVFTVVDHVDGQVVTGWNFENGGGRSP